MAQLYLLTGKSWRRSATPYCLRRMPLRCDIRTESWYSRNAASSSSTASSAAVILLTRAACLPSPGSANRTDGVVLSATDKSTIMSNEGDRRAVSSRDKYCGEMPTLSDNCSCVRPAAFRNAFIRQAIVCCSSFVCFLFAITQV